MRNKTMGVFLLVMLILSAFMWPGCTSYAQPSDEDIIKAIDDSGIMKRADGRFTVLPPVIIAQRGQQNKDGSWPVKVAFTLAFKTGDGRTSPPTTTTTSFKIFRAKDNVGTSVWKAQLGA